MEKKFQQIKNEYDKFYNSLLRKGKLPMGDTDIGFWGASISEDVFEFFRKIKLQNFRHFIDLGSGDGKVALIASLFTKSTGIEFDSDLHKKAVEIRDRLKLNASIVKGDFLKQDLSKYDIMFINPDKPFSKGLERKLMKDMKGVLFVYNMIYRPDNLKKGKTYWISNIPITKYTLT
jgi:16S rRNA A1518/A1519 N6-dimethyltransferase RsmA/KsgA/DIM1 with predicted DNA glycosylase/AP lyase activity